MPRLLPLSPAAMALAAWALSGGAILACPFCSAYKPTLSQDRESAAVVALAEVTSRADATLKVRVHHVASGKSRMAGVASLAIESDLEARPGALVLLLAEAPDDGKLQWTAFRASELSFAYLLKAPSLRTDQAERLKYFAKYLEHADPAIAEDAYLEFAHAPFDVVAKTADSLDGEKLRAWLADEAVPAERKGLYGLALGLVGPPEKRAENAKFLRKLVEAPGTDFQAGWDGIIGGFLVADGEAALKTLEELYLAKPDAAVGHVRHAMTALRFYREFGRDIPPERLAQATRRLVERPAFAALAIADLARLEDWDSVDAVAALFGRKDFDDVQTKKAVVFFLLACPRPEARTRLAAIRQRDEKFVAAAERQFGQSDQDK
ncbi:MAG: hypothetical protein HYS13_20300 [Planctomycetia bacterium]|nr:hypothetical protein [Planctomycetia bacterium]